MSRLPRDNSFFEVFSRGDFIRPSKEADDAFVDISCIKKATGLISFGVLLSLLLPWISYNFVLLPCIGCILFLIGCAFMRKSNFMFRALIYMNSAQFLWFTFLVVLSFYPVESLTGALRILNYILKFVGLLQLICLYTAIKQLNNDENPALKHNTIPVITALYVILFILNFGHSDLIIILKVLLCAAGAVLLHRFYRNAN